MAEEWITTAEAADLSGYHPNHIRRLLKQGSVDGRKWGQAWQVNRASLFTYLDRIRKIGKKRGPKPD